MCIGCAWRVLAVAVITWLTVMAKQPVLATSHRLFKGWTYMICCFVLFGNGFVLTANIMEYTYARVGTVGDTGPRWFLLTNEIKGQLLNATTLCQMYGKSDFC